jgi:hypothetical protein
MLPIFPRPGPEEMPAPPSPPVPWHLPRLPMLAARYAAAGAVSGAIDGAIFGGIDGAWIQFVDARFPPPLGPIGYCAVQAIAGLVLGIFCGLILWVMASVWPPARHPVRAASLCASLGGALFLVLLVLGVPVYLGGMRAGFATQMVLVVAVIFFGVLFGFLTAWLVNQMDRVLSARRERQAELDPEAAARTQNAPELS